MAEDSLLSAEQKFALIETVRGHPMLYDKKDDDYHNVERKNRVWANIAAKEGVQLESGKEAKESWDRLRTLFKRNHNKKAASGSGAAKTPKWQFYTAMEFLESHSEPRADGSPAGCASPFSASSPASTSTVTNYVLEQQYNPSQVLFPDS